MQKLTLLAASVLLLVSPNAVFAFEPAQITPVSWIIATRHNDDVDGKRVVLVGRVTRPDQGSDWWFTDGTASVRLDTGDKELPINRKLIIRGEIDQAKLGVGYLEVEVDDWEYAR